MLGANIGTCNAMRSKQASSSSSSGCAGSAREHADTLRLHKNEEHARETRQGKCREEERKEAGPPSLPSPTLPYLESIFASGQFAEMKATSWGSACMSSMVTVSLKPVT